MRIDLNVTIEDPIAGRKLDQVLSLLQQVIQKENHMSQQLDDLAAEVEEVKTVEASAITLLNGLSAALAAAGTDPAKLTALRADLKSNTDALAAAVAANTIPASPPAP